MDNNGPRMCWAARALALVLLLAGCGRYPSAGVVTTTEVPAAPPAAASPPPERSETPMKSAQPAARTRVPDRPTGTVPAPPAATPSAVADPRAQVRLALVVGVDDYPGTHDLRAAEADARTVARTLLRLGFPPSSTRVLLGHEASAARILAGLRWLGRGTGPAALGVFFFAGHVRKVGGDPDGDGEELDEVLVGADGGVVTDGALAATLAPAPGRMWLAYAGCYAAGFDDAAAANRISTYASGEDALAYESTALGHSFMVEYMVRRAIPEAGPVSVEGLYRSAWNRMEGKQERFRPLQDDRVRGDLVLGAMPAPRPGPRPASGPPAPSPTPSPTDRPCLVVFRCRD